MKFEMATLHATSAARDPEDALAIRSRRLEWNARIKRMFCDVLGHFRGATVANRRHWIVAAAVLFAGCAGFGGLSADAPGDVKSKAVEARAQARWDRLIGLDLAGAYEYLSPASRATMPLDVYKAKHKVGMYRSVTIDNVNCEADTCTVKLRLTYDFKKYKGVTTPLVEKWIISQGQAWFVDRG